jgi:integrase
MLTDAAIQRALRAGNDTRLSDGKGKSTGRLVLVIRSKRGEWYAQQWLNGKKRLRKLGTYPAMSLAVARERFVSDFAETIATKSDIRITMDAKPGTLKDLFDGYLSHLLEQGKTRTHRDTKYSLDRALENLNPNALARDVTTEQINAVLRPIYQRGKKSMADHTRGYMSAAFNWAIKSENDYRNEAPKRYRIRLNPCAAIPTEKKVAGNRWLSAPELHDFWQWLLVDHHHPSRSRELLRLLLLTGQRIVMIATLHRSQFDGSCLYWERTKTGVPHLLPLPAQAVEILNGIEPNEHGWFFPQMFSPEHPMEDRHVLELIRRYRFVDGVSWFNGRDLRRTWKTLAGKAGISKDDRDRLQCHARGDVSSRHYDRYEYLVEKRAAMDRWSDWFRAEIEKATV